MTVNYNSKVFTASDSYKGIFLSLLARWRGSVYKLVWFDLTVFVFIYAALSFSYRLDQSILNLIANPENAHFQQVRHDSLTYVRIGLLSNF